MSAKDGANKTDTATRSLAGMQVLVVEDTWHVAKALKAALEGIRMTVVGPVARIADAERLLETECPDLAMVDVNLKGEMAYGLIDHLHHKGIRVIVVTGYAVLAHPVCKEAVILQKPFSGRALVAALQQAACMNRSP
jgi:DNA-binding response OmpR family regulator